MKKTIPNILDLFAGAGGMSFGVEQAGFSVEAAVEQDQWACETLALNHAGTRIFQRDITQITDE